MNLKKAGIFFAFILACNTLSSQPLKLVLPIGHTRPNGINKQQFTPDGKYVITSSEDMTVKIWDVCSGKLLHNLTGHSGIVATVEYLCSPGGTTVVTLDPDGVFRLWNIQSGQLHFTISPASSRAAWGFDANDTTLFILDQSGRAWQYSPRKKKLLYTIPGYSGDAILNAALSHDLKYLAVYKNNGPLTIFSKPKGTKIKDLPASTRTLSIETLLFSPDDSFICAGYFDNSIHLWHTKTFQHRGIDSIYKANHSSLIAFSNSENNLAFVSPADEVVICELPNLSISQVFPPLQEGVDEIQFCGYQKLLVSGFDSTLTVWDYSNGTKLHEFKEFGDLPGTLDYDEKNDYFLAGIWNKTTGIWRGDNYEPVQLLKGSSSTIIDYDVTPSKKIVLTAGDDGIARLWDIVNGRISQAYPAHSREVSQISFFKNGKQFITSSMDGSVKKWNLAEKKPLLFMEGHEGGVKSAALYKKDSVILSLAHFQGGLPRIWNSNNGNLLFDIRQGTEFIDEAGYCNQDKFIYTISLDNNISYFRLYDAVTIKEVMKFQQPEAYFQNPQFDKNGERLLLHGVNQNIWILDVKTGKLLLTINSGADWLMGAEFTDHDNKVISTERYGDVRIWDSYTGKLVDSFHVNSDDLLYSRINNSATKMLLVDKSRNVSELQIKGRRITKDVSIKPGDYSLTDSLVFICDEAELLMFNLPKGKFIASFINVDTDASLVLLPNGYYFGDKSSTQKLHYVKNGRIITFDQLDIKFNRPDLVLAAIGNTDTVLLRSYRNAWEKRIKKLGIDTSFFKENYTVPETEFEGRNSIGYEQNEKLRLHIKSTDKKSPLDRFNIWINEVPLFGIRGISIKERKITFFDTTLSVRLSRGKNIIETSVTNLNGVESYREPLTVYYNPPFPEQQTAHFIGIGIDLYADSQYNLQYSAKDIRDLAVKLKEKFGDNITIDTLFNQNVTVENVRSLKNKLLTTGVNDKVIVAYSGHGLLNKDFDYYLSTYQVNFNKPEENGLSYNELENLLDNIPARKKLMLIDACHSGEVDKDELVRLAETPDSLVKGLQPVAFKQDENNLGLKNSFELMQNLFVNVGKSTGAIVISAAAGTQFALERNDLKNGVFSFCILEAMNNYPTMKVSELKKIISEKVEQITNGLQKPTYRNEAIAVDWNIW